jgi:hypothetical protein
MRLICEKYKNYWNNPRYKSTAEFTSYPMNRIALILTVTVVVTVLMCWLIPSPAMN